MMDDATPSTYWGRGGEGDWDDHFAIACETGTIWHVTIGTIQISLSELVYALTMIYLHIIEFKTFLQVKRNITKLQF